MWKTLEQGKNFTKVSQGCALGMCRGAGTIHACTVVGQSTRCWQKKCSQLLYHKGIGDPACTQLLANLPRKGWLSSFPHHAFVLDSEGDLFLP